MADYLAVNKKDLEKAIKAVTKVEDALNVATGVLASILGDEFVQPAKAGKKRGRPKGKKNAQKEAQTGAADASEAAAPVSTNGEVGASSVTHAPPPQPKALKAVALPKVQPKAAAKLPKMPGRA